MKIYMVDKPVYRWLYGLIRGHLDDYLFLFLFLSIHAEKKQIAHVLCHFEYISTYML